MIDQREFVIEQLKQSLDTGMAPVYAMKLARDYLLKPIDMILFCPMCGVQHIDAPEVVSKIFACHHSDPMNCECDNKQWTNPPHRSHLCHACGCIWRPADVPTNGVREIATKGQADNFAERKETLRRILR